MATIEEILTQCLADLERGDGVEDCLARHPARRAQLKPLLHAAEHLRSTPDVVPSVAFRRHARSRLMSKIEARSTVEQNIEDEQRRTAPRRRKLRFRMPVLVRRLAMPALAVMAVLALLGTMGLGVAYASSNSLPGDALYPLKRFSERVQLVLSPDETARAQLHLGHASERLEEAWRLAELQRTEDVETAMSSYVSALAATSRILQRQRAAGNDSTSLSDHLDERVADHQLVLQQIQQNAGDEIQPAVERAMTASEVARKLAAEPPGQARTPEPPGQTRTPQPPGQTRTPQPPGQTRTPQPPGQTMTPQPPGQTRTPQPPGQTMTPQPPGQTRTPQPPGQTRTPQPPGQTRTPQPPGQTRTPQPPGQTMTPQPPGQTMTPQPPGKTRTPQPPGQTMTPQPPGQTMTPQPPGQTRTPQPPGQTRTPEPPGRTRTPGSP